MLNAMLSGLNRTLSKWEAARWRKVADRRLALRREVNRAWPAHVGKVAVEREEKRNGRPGRRADD